MITRDSVLAWLREYRRVIGENKEYLTALDSAIGDADHGINMDRGFEAVIGKLPGVANSDIGAILKAVGMTLVSTVGGAGGPLYGTFFMRAGAAVVAAAEAGMKATIPMKATKGRASYLGDRSIDHQDPGATSSYLLLKTMSEVLGA